MVSAAEEDIYQALDYCCKEVERGEKEKKSKRKEVLNDRSNIRIVENITSPLVYFLRFSEFYWFCRLFAYAQMCNL